MKKDIFNGKIKSGYERYTLGTIILVSVVCLIFGVLFLCVGLFYDKVNVTDRIVLYVASGVTLFLAVLYPAVTMFAIRSYPKHKKLAHGMIKSWLFISEDGDEGNDDGELDG